MERERHGDQSEIGTQRAPERVPSGGGPGGQAERSHRKGRTGRGGEKEKKGTKRSEGSKEEGEIIERAEAERTGVEKVGGGGGEWR